MAASLKEWKNSESHHHANPSNHGRLVLCFIPIDSLWFCFVLNAEKLFIVTSDGRTIVGTLLGNDQVQNLILNDAIERVYSSDADVEEVPLGLYVIRGDNLCLVGEYDETKFKEDERVPEPIKPVLQHIDF